VNIDFREIIGQKPTTGIKSTLTLSQNATVAHYNRLNNEMFLSKQPHPSQ